MNDQIQNLQSELRSAREDLVRLAATAVPDGDMLFFGYYHCKTTTDFYQWERNVRSKVTAAAVPDPESRHERRAYCPLCKEGTDSWSVGTRGFTLPEGLHRHLEGSARARQCFVMATLSILANEYERPIRETERQKREEIEKNRRHTERLFSIGDRKPKLIDEDVWDCRNKEQLTWAEERLQSLGFKSELRDNTITYSRQYGDFTIIADPRRINSICFRAFHRTKHNQMRRHGSFSIPDAWKNELPFKFKNMADQACGIKAGEVTRYSAA